GGGRGRAARQDDEGGAALAHHRRRPSSGIRAADPNPAGMTVDNELGVLDTEDVEATLKDHFDDIRSCYQRAGKAQRYAGGRVMLRFIVGGDGIAQDVLVVESSLGNYDVERCLVEVGRRIAFHAPTGHKATTFEYPVEFRSTNQL